MAVEAWEGDRGILGEKRNGSEEVELIRIGGFAPGDAALD